MLLPDPALLPQSQPYPHHLSEYDRRLSEFNLKRPMRPSYQNRVTSWSDPVSARGLTGPAPQSRRGSGAGVDGADESQNISLRGVVGEGAAKDDMSIMSIRRRDLEEGPMLVRCGSTWL